MHSSPPSEVGSTRQVQGQSTQPVRLRASQTGLPLHTTAPRARKLLALPRSSRRASPAPRQKVAAGSILGSDLRLGPSEPSEKQNKNDNRNRRGHSHRHVVDAYHRHLCPAATAAAGRIDGVHALRLRRERAGSPAQQVCGTQHQPPAMVSVLCVADPICARCNMEVSAAHSPELGRLGL